MNNLKRGWLSAAPALTLLLALPGPDARAWVTLAEREKGKVELEARS